VYIYISYLLERWRYPVNTFIKLEIILELEARAGEGDAGQDLVYIGNSSPPLIIISNFPSEGTIEKTTFEVVIY
jgi:hypothetical protein